MDMVRDQIEARGIQSPRVLEAMRKVPRQRFVPDDQAPYACGDHPLPIGHGQTISQPYIVALMTELVEPAPGSRVLEIGAGSGYQAAVLAELAGHVYTVEIIDPLAERARRNLLAAGYENISVRHGDGYNGWPEFAPYDAIVVTAATPRIPPPLIEQLKEGGRMVIPLGEIFEVQQLTLIEKKDGRAIVCPVLPVRFVPFTRSNGPTTE